METGFLSALSPERLGVVTAQGTRKEFAPGSAINTPDDSVIVIFEGEVRCAVIDLAGNPFSLGSGGAGEVFGELSFFSAERPHDEKVTIIASTKVIGINISRQLFQKIVEENPAAVRFLLQQNLRRLLNMNRFAINAVQIGADPEKQAATTVSERMADLITKHIGSWHCVAGFVVGVLVWMIGNAVLGSYTIDPYPFIFLNLILSSISALTLPVILMSQNRQSQADRHSFRATQLLIKQLEKELSQLKASG